MIIRSAIAKIFGTKSSEAHRGDWWEIDLLLVMLLGAFALGIAAWFQIFG